MVKHSPKILASEEKAHHHILTKVLPRRTRNSNSKTKYEETHATSIHSVVVLSSLHDNSPDVILCG